MRKPLPAAVQVLIEQITSRPPPSTIQVAFQRGGLGVVGPDLTWSWTREKLAGMSVSELGWVARAMNRSHDAVE